MSKELEAIDKISEQLEGYKTELAEKADKATIEGAETEIKSLRESLNELTEKEIDKSIERINGTQKEMHEQIATMREEQQQSKESNKGSKMMTYKQLRESVAKFVEERYPKGGKNDGAFPSIEMPAPISKAPETFGFNQTFNGDGTGVQIDVLTGREVDPALYQRIRKKRLILDHIPVTSISVPKLYYLEKEEVGDTEATAGDPGSADWITSGGEKPKRSFRLKTGEVEAKKVAIFGTVEDKLLRDVASMENWIREDFMNEMLKKYNDGLLNNDPSVNPDAPLGMKTNAVAFTATPAFDGTFANGASNLIDQIVATAAFMANNNESPSKVFIADDNFYSLHVLKANDSKYLNNDMVYTNAVGQLFIAGIEVVKVDNLDVQSTHLLMISQDLGFKVRNYGSMVFERGLNGEDFRYDRTSYRGYQEVLSYIAEQRENSVVYDTLANIATGIEAAA